MDKDLEELEGIEKEVNERIRLVSSGQRVLFNKFMKKGKPIFKKYPNFPRGMDASGFVRIDVNNLRIMMMCSVFLLGYLMMDIDDTFVQGRKEMKKEWMRQLSERTRKVKEDVYIIIKMLNTALDAPKMRGNMWTKSEVKYFSEIRDYLLRNVVTLLQHAKDYEKTLDCINMFQKYYLRRPKGQRKREVIDPFLGVRVSKDHEEGYFHVFTVMKCAILFVQFRELKDDDHYERFYNNMDMIGKLLQSVKLSTLEPHYVQMYENVMTEYFYRTERPVLPRNHLKFILDYFLRKYGSKHEKVTELHLNQVEYQIALLTHETENESDVEDKIFVEGETRKMIGNIEKYQRLSEHQKERLQYLKHVFESLARGEGIPDLKNMPFVRRLVAQKKIDMSRNRVMRKMSMKTKDQLGGTKCKVCGGKDKNALQICSRCKRVYYCSRECQRKDWKSHKKDCK